MPHCNGRKKSKFKLKTMRPFLTTILCFFIVLNLCAQDKIPVKGKIMDNLGPVPYATVTIKNTQIGTTSNIDGNFTINAPQGATLVISLIGYTSQEVKVRGMDSIIVQLVETESKLDEFVVIGYQKVTRKKTTSAISSISGKELENLPASSFDQLLQGRLSGVNVQNFSGQPGASPTVSIRGSTLVSSNYDEYNVVNTPLYVVDGVPQPTENYVGPGTGTSMNYLGGVNPTDIESIDVLKDASATSIYGARAANGVILITTKKGRSGAPKVEVSIFGGFTQRPDLRDATLGTVERRQKMEVIESQLTYDQKRNLPSLLTDSLNPAFNGNTDWQDLFYQTGSVKNANISLSGGGEGGMNYRFSVGYYDEEGIVKATGQKRYSTRLNLFSKALKGKLEINPIIAYSRLDKARGNGGTADPFSVGAGTMPSSLFNLSESKRNFLIGSYNKDLDKNINNNLQVNLNLALSINKHLRLNSLTSYINTTSQRDYNRPNELMSGLGNYSYSYSDNSVSFATSNYFSYINSFGKHNLTGVVGSDVQTNQLQYSTAFGAEGASDQIRVIQGFLQNKIGVFSDYQAHGLLSFYGRFSYDFDSKYLLSFSSRYDGSSRFGKNNKWGFFPAVSAAWVISDEKFMEHSIFSLFKLRGSYGVSGSEPQPENVANANYLQYNMYRVNAGSFSGNNGAASYNGVTAITPNFFSGVAQKNLSWEKSTQWNGGLDMEVSKGKFSASIDVYNRETSLQLFAVQLPVTTGYDQAVTNSIGIRNAGVELALAAYPLKTSSSFKWFSRVNIAYNKNQIMSLPNGGRDLVMQGSGFDKTHILSIGSPNNAFYLYKTLGVFADANSIPLNPYTGVRYRNSNGEFRPGTFNVADLDGDYFIDIFNSDINPDKVPMGDPNPKYTGGWTNTLTYKNLSFTVFCTYTFDRDVLNQFEANQFSNSPSGDATANFVFYSTPDFSKLNIWKNPGDQAVYAKPDIGTYLYYYTPAQTFFLEKGDYFRIKSVNLSYNLGQNFLQKLHVDRINVFAVMDNVAMFQKSKKLPDAEAVNPYGEYNGYGYPIPKKYTLGLTVNF